MPLGANDERDFRAAHTLYTRICVCVLLCVGIDVCECISLCVKLKGRREEEQESQK